MNRTSLALILTLIFTATVAAQEIPLTLGYQGYLTDQADQPITGSYPMTFRLYNAASGGALVWEERHGSVDVVEGSFTVDLGAVESLPAEYDVSSPLYLTLQADGDDEVSPRMRLGGALRAQWAQFALVADHAMDVTNEDIHPRSVSIGDQEVIDAQGNWVGSLDGMRGERGPQGDRGERGLQGEAGERGPRGDQGDRGDQGPVGPRGRDLNFATDSDQDGWYDWVERAVGTSPDDSTDVPADVNNDGVADLIAGPQGPRGVEGPEGPQGAIGPEGPRGEAGPRGEIGPEGQRGPAGELDLTLDSDNDGFPDWIEVSVGTDVNDGQSVPADADNNGIADGVQGVQGPVGPAGAIGQEGPEGPRGQAGARGAAGPAGPAGPAGRPGDIGAPQFDGRYGLNLGDVVPGDTVTSAQQPLVIADNNQFGVTGVIVAPEPGTTIERLSVDVNIDHPDISQLTVTLISPAGTEIVLHNPDAGDGAGLVKNFPRQRSATIGTMEDCFDEATPGVWSLKIVDSVEGPFAEDGSVIEGRLVSWSVNFNEEWTGSDIFTGNDMIVDGKVETRTGVEITMGGELKLSNPERTRELIISAQDGIRIVGSSARIPLIVTPPTITSDEDVSTSNVTRFFDGNNSSNSYGQMSFSAGNTANFTQCMYATFEQANFLNKFSVTGYSKTDSYYTFSTRLYVKQSGEWVSKYNFGEATSSGPSTSHSSQSTYASNINEVVQEVKLCFEGRCTNSSYCTRTIYFYLYEMEFTFTF